ncbi:MULTISPECIES: response regulator [Nostocales]|uniref:Response regulator n=4 Tax=Nostocales TaxID=1161 RepID=A0A0C1MYD1_9CYAN|nr:response regulator [Tolypothrix bouteillei]KAF3889159.1 response regulator [Tolypothrix bouteillei VB521301]
MTAAIKRILICDDIADNCLLLKTILEAENCYVEIADSGLAVLAQIETDDEPPDLLILDVMMPDMDGYEVVRRIRKLDKLNSLPILLVTGVDKNDIQDNSDVRVDGLIQKPIDVDAIIAQVQAILDRRP